VKRFVLAASIMLAASACSPPVMFSVDVDEPISGGTLTLNGASARLMKNIDGAYWGIWNGADASGTIEVLYPGGQRASCSVGYVTPGMSIQTYTIRNRKCQGVMGQ
jgi:hypothetical protein